MPQKVRGKSIWEIRGNPGRRESGIKSVIPLCMLGQKFPVPIADL